MIRKLIVAAAVLTGLLTSRPAAAQGARLQLDRLNGLSAKASETVDISVDTAMLKQALSFLGSQQGDAAQLQKAVEGITGIYVKGFEFRGAGGYSDADIEGIRKQASGPGWSRMISVRDKGELTEIYYWSQKGETGGLAIIAAESNELTVVNIVGRVDLATLAALGPMIPKLPAAIVKEKNK